MVAVTDEEYLYCRGLLTFSNFTKFHHHYQHTTVGIDQASPVKKTTLIVTIKYNEDISSQQGPN